MTLGFEILEFRDFQIHEFKDWVSKNRSRERELEVERDRERSRERDVLFVTGNIPSML